MRKPAPPSHSPRPEEQEEALIRRAQAGDQHAFAELVLAHQCFVYNLALRGTGDACEAEDIAQEAFLRAWQGLPGFRCQAQFRTWLYRIVVNLCYNRLPHLKQELAALQLDEVDRLPEAEAEGLPGWRPPSPEASLDAAEQRRFVQRQVEGLPDSYRVLILLRFQQGLAYEEIAEVMSLPLGTVKTGLFRARQQLRQALLAYEEVPV